MKRVKRKLFEPEDPCVQKIGHADGFVLEKCAMTLKKEDTIYINCVCGWRDSISHFEKGAIDVVFDRSRMRIRMRCL